MAAIAAATMAFSCLEEANIETPETNDGALVYNGPTITLNFNIAAPESKTCYEDESQDWVQGDMIKIVWIDKDGKPGEYQAEIHIDDNLGTASVTAEVGDADYYYAVYPETTVCELKDNEFRVTIPKVQDGTFAAANIMAAKTSKDDAKLKFKNLTHILKFDLSKGCKYNLFRFRSNSTGDDVRMAATPSLITFGEDIVVGVPENYNGKQTGYAIVKLDANAKGPFYLGIRAGSDLEGGFGVLASKTGKEADFTGGLITTTTITADRSKMTNLGTLDKYISDDWYITSTGTGSGKSWADAAGIDLLVKLMKNQTSSGETYTGNGTTNIYRLIDAKIHVAAGTYDIHTANGGANMNVAGLVYNADRYKSTKITIIGGYPAKPVDGDKPVIGENGSETIFTTNIEASSNPRAFNFDGSTIGYLVFEGISFKTANVNAVGNVNFANNVQGSATFNNCYFSVQSTNSNQGAALRSTAGSNLSISVNNCTFKNNTVAKGNGGAIYKKGKSHLKITNCTFAANSARCGGAIYNDKSTLIIDNCIFTENQATGINNSDGAAIYSVDSSSSSEYTEDISNLYVYNSIFYKNSATRQGGAIRANGVGNLVVVNSTFNSNTSNNGNCDIFLRTDQASSDKGVKGYVINCTLSDSRLYTQTCTCNCYNSVFKGYYANGTAAPVTKFTNCIFTAKAGSMDDLAAGLYVAENELSSEVTNFDDLFGTYADGIVQLGGAALTYGMSSTALAALGAEGSALMTAMPLLDASKLTVDQKGNSREGKTIMGAYVGQ